MCLRSYNTKPLVCDEDLVVYKALAKEGDGYVTPFQRKPVKFGEVLRAEGEFPELPSDWSENNVGEGAVHAYLSKSSASVGTGMGEIFKAAIPAGTPFYVDFDFGSIAAKELRITSQKINLDKWQETEKTAKAVFNLLMGQDYMANKDGVRVGDVLLSDCKTYVHAEDIGDGMDVIGIVAFIRADGKPQAMGLKHRRGQWRSGNIGIDILRSKNSIEGKISMACSDFDGYGHTEEYKGCNEKVYPAFAYCLGYSTNGTKPGDWYLPSSGEITQTIRNTVFINKTVRELNGKIPSAAAHLLMMKEWYCSSTLWLGFDILASRTLTGSLAAITAQSVGTAIPFLHLP